jgi:hypothetical protein
MSDDIFKKAFSKSVDEERQRSIDIEKERQIREEEDPAHIEAIRGDVESVVRSILESKNISSRKPNTASISKTQLGKMISDGTYYLSCWMTTAQIEKMRSKKVIFQNLN